MCCFPYSLSKRLFLGLVSEATLPPINSCCDQHGWYSTHWFFLTRCIVQHIWYFLSLASRSVPFYKYWGLVFTLYALCIDGPSCLSPHHSALPVWGTDFFMIILCWAHLWLLVKILGNSFLSWRSLRFPRGSEVIVGCSNSCWSSGGCYALPLISPGSLIVLLISIADIVLRFRSIGGVYPHSVSVHWWRILKCFPDLGVPSLQWADVVVFLYPLII